MRYDPIAAIEDELRKLEQEADEFKREIRMLEDENEILSEERDNLEDIIYSLKSQLESYKKDHDINFSYWDFRQYPNPEDDPQVVDIMNKGDTVVIVMNEGDFLHYILKSC